MHRPHACGPRVKAAPPSLLLTAVVTNSFVILIGIVRIGKAAGCQAAENSRPIESASALV